MATDIASVELASGSDMSQQDLDIINDFRVRELKSEILIEPKPGNEAWHQLFFLVRLDAKLVAFGRLHSLKVEFKNEIHDVLGIASIVAI
jgi:hypothetical protein